MNFASRCAAAFGVLMLSIACSGVTQPAAPTPALLPAPAAAPPAPVVMGTVYSFSAPLSYAVRPYTTASRYVLDDHGGFSLQYPSGPGEYRGTYRHEGDTLFLKFAGDTRWDAVGTLKGDVLEVRYNLTMELSDFEDAIYQRTGPD